MADNKSLKAALKRSGSDEKKSKKHSRQKSGVPDVKVDKDSGQENQLVTEKQAEIQDDVMLPKDSIDIADGKGKKKSRLGKLSFRKKKKKDAASAADGDTSLSVESSTTVSETAADEDKFTGTRNNEAASQAGGVKPQEEKKNTDSPIKDPLTAIGFPIRRASSLTIVSSLAESVASLTRQENGQAQETGLKNLLKGSSDHLEEINVEELGPDFLPRIDVVGDDGMNLPIEITDIAEGLPRPSDLSIEDQQEVIEKEKSIVDVIYAILQHLKEMAFGSDRYSHASEITSQTCKLIVITLDQSFARFENVFNFLLNQAEETTKKIVMFFLASLIKKYPHCFKVCKVKKMKKIVQKLDESSTLQSLQKDTVI